MIVLGVVELKLIDYATGKQPEETTHPVILEKTGKQHGTMKLKVNVTNGLGFLI